MLKKIIGFFWYSYIFTAGFFIAVFYRLKYGDLDKAIEAIEKRNQDRQDEFYVKYGVKYDDVDSYFKDLVK